MSDAFQTHGAFSWTELRTGDQSRAKTFYTDVLGWEFEEMDMPNGKYAVIKVGGQSVGGIMPSSGGNGSTSWAAYVTVDDVDARVAKATSAGGKVLTEAMDVPGVGRIATIEDPTGAAICLITYAPRDGG